MKNRYMTPVQSFAFGGIANPVQRAMLRGSDKRYLEERQRELDAFEEQRLAYNTALQDWQTNVYEPYRQQATAYDTAAQQYNTDIYDPYRQQVDAYNTAAQQYNTDVYNPYMTQFDVYQKAIEAYNAGDRLSDYSGPAAPTLNPFGMTAPTAPKPFEMQAPTAPTDFSMSAPVLPFKEEDVQKYQQEAAGRARTDAAGRALAIDVVSDPDRFNFGSMSVANRFMAKGGSVEKTARERMDDMYRPQDVQRFAGGGAVSDQDVASWLQSNPGASDATIAAAMRQYGVSPAQMARVTGLALEAVQSRYNATSVAAGGPVSREEAMRIRDEQLASSPTEETDRAILANYESAVRALSAPASAPASAAVDLAQIANTPGMGSGGIGVNIQPLPAAAALATATSTPKPAPAPAATSTPTPATSVAAGNLAAIAAVKAAAASTPKPAPAAITPEIARDLMVRGMTTGVPTSEFDRYGGYNAVAAVYNNSGGTYSLDNVPKETLTSLANTVAQTGVGNLSVLKKAGVPLTQAGYENMLRNGIDPTSAAEMFKEYGAIKPATPTGAKASTLPMLGAIANWSTPPNFAGAGLSGVSGYTGPQPTDYSSILSARPVGWDGTSPRPTGSTGQPASGTVVPGPGSETPLTPTIVPSFMDYTSRGVGAIGDVGGIRMQGPSMPVFGNERLGGGAAINPSSYFAQTPQTSTGLAPGSAAIGPADMPLYGAMNTMGAIGANPNLSPTMLGGQQNAGMYTDRLGNRIYSPGMPPLRPPGYARGGEVDLDALAQQNAENLSDEEPEEAINTNPVGTAQQMLADLAGTERSSPTRMAVKRTKTSAGGGASADKAMKMSAESLAKGDLGAMKETAAAKAAPESARSQMEELARVYQLRMAAARNKARGLSADTFGAPTLEGPTLTKNTLAKKRFAKGGEAKKSEAEVAEPSLFGVSDYATKASAKMFPDQLGQDDQRDAARHMLAAATVSRKYGPKAAELLGKAHEYTSNPQTFFSLFGIGQPRDDLPYDVHNNRIGAELAARATSQADLERLVQALALQAQTKQTKDKPYIMSREQMQARKEKAEKGPSERPEYRAKGSPEEGEVTDPEAALFAGRGDVPAKPGMTGRELAQQALYGVGDLPYVMAGAPVDLAAMAMAPFGYKDDKPFMGSADIKARMTRAGIRPADTTDPRLQGPRTASELLASLTNPAAVSRKVGPVVEKGVKAGAMEVGRQLDRAIMDNAGPLAKVVPQSAKPLYATAPKAGRSTTPLFSPLPSAQAPFVGRLDKFVAELPGAVQKDQFLGMLKGKFRDHEIGRAQEALEDLDGAAKVSPSDLLNRIKQDYDPARYRTQIVEPQDGAFYSTMDNPYQGRPMGVIHLIQDADPLKAAKEASALDTFDALVSSTYGTMGRSDQELINQYNNIKQALEGARVPNLSAVKRAFVPYAKASRARTEFSDLQDTLIYPNMSDSYKSYLAEAQKTYGNAVPKEVNRQLEDRVMLETAEKMATKYGMQELVAQIPDFAKNRHLRRDFSPLYDGAVAENVEAMISATNATLRDTLRDRSSELRQSLNNATPARAKDYRGQHSTLKNDPNPISFSRFTEHTADIPGMGATKGIYVHELQSDRLDDIRKFGPLGGSGKKDYETRLMPLESEHSNLLKEYMELRAKNPGSPDLAEKKKTLALLDRKRNAMLERVMSGKYALKESFPGMEDSPQVIQQLMAKNAVAGAIERGANFVAFPGAESAQAQLYEKLPNNLRQVVKDLGPGFEYRSVTLQSSDGKDIMHPAIVWGPEGVAKTRKEGIPFKKGGMVDKNTAFIQAHS